MRRGAFPPSRRLAGLGVALLVTACAGADTPGDVVRRYYGAIQAERCADAFALLTTESQVQFKTMTGLTDAEIPKSYCKGSCRCTSIR